MCRLLLGLSKPRSSKRNLSSCTLRRGTLMLGTLLRRDTGERVNVGIMGIHYKRWTLLLASSPTSFKVRILFCSGRQTMVQLGHIVSSMLDQLARLPVGRGQFGKVGSGCQPLLGGLVSSRLAASALPQFPRSISSPRSYLSLVSQRLLLLEHSLQMEAPHQICLLMATI
eukprot:SAG31_NODE_621_length_13502_cov_18.057002_11_plen_170_part_00